MYRYRLLAIALVGLGLWQQGQNQPVNVAPGRVVPSDPVQTNPAWRMVYRVGRYTLEPLADFAITARVLGREIYYFDRGAKLAPVDLALGWGPMSDSAVLDRLEISQSQRFYYYR